MKGKYTISHMFKQVTEPIWSYTVEVDENGLINACSNMPGGRQHWCIGKNIAEIYDGVFNKINDDIKFIKII